MIEFANSPSSTQIGSMANSTELSIPKDDTETTDSTIDTTTDSIADHTLADHTIESKCTTSSAEKVPKVKKTIKKHKNFAVVRRNWPRDAIDSIVYPKLRPLTPDSDEANELKWGCVGGVGNGV